MNSDKNINDCFSKRYRKFLLSFIESELWGYHGQIKDILSGIDIIKYWCICDEIREDVIYINVFISLGDRSVTESYIKGKFPGARVVGLIGTEKDCIEFMHGLCALNDETSSSFEDSESSFSRSYVNYRMIFFDIVFLSIVLIFFILGFFGILQQYLPDGFIAYCFIAGIVFLVGDLIIMGVRIWKNRQLRKKK